MEIVMFKNRSFFPGVSISPDFSGILNVLPDSIKNLKINLSRTREDIDSTILLNTPEKQMVLTALHKDTEVYSFQSKDSITFEVIEGKLSIHVGNQTELIEKGQSMAIYEKVEYILKAMEETMFLLTISSE